MKKKILSSEDLNAQDSLRDKIFRFLNISMYQIFSTFDTFKKCISPNISTLQNHFDLADKSKNDEIKLQKSGILNAHLCVNAETKLSHTECDSSYTTICVPPYHIDKTPSGIYNKAEFE